MLDERIDAGQIENVREQLLVHNADLTASRFSDAQLENSSFVNVALQRSSFTDVNLAGASFADVDLSDVCITDSNVSGMRINGVLLSDLIRAYEENRREGL